MLPTAVEKGRLVYSRHQYQFNKEEINGGDKKLQTPLMKTCLIPDKMRRTRLVLATKLLKMGADVNASDKGGRTVLMIACMHKRDDIVDLLLSKCVLDLDLNKKDNFDNIALHYSCRAGNEYVVQKLVQLMSKFRLDLFPRNAEGRTPIDEALKNKNLGCAKIIQQASFITGYRYRNTEFNLNDSESLNNNGFTGKTEHFPPSKESQSPRYLQKSPRHVQVQRGNSLTETEKIFVTEENRKFHFKCQTVSLPLLNTPPISEKSQSVNFKGSRRASLPCVPRSSMIFLPQPQEDQIAHKCYLPNLSDKLAESKQGKLLPKSTKEMCTDLFGLLSAQQSPSFRRSAEQSQSGSSKNSELAISSEHDKDSDDVELEDAFDDAPTTENEAKTETKLNIEKSDSLKKSSSVVRQSR